MPRMFPARTGRVRLGHMALIAALAVSGGCVLWLTRPRDGGGTRTWEAEVPTTGPTTRGAADFAAPAPRAAGERVNERRVMVEEQIANPRDGRDPVTDKRVIEAMLAVPRHAFVPEALRTRAYADFPLPIGYDQTISQPYIVALMTEHLKVRPGAKVLEIGTGSGYQAAVLAHLTPNVWTIEIVEELAKTAHANLRGQGYKTVAVRAGDGYLGWPERAPFDGIIVTCAPEKLPKPLWDQLAPGGRIVIPIGTEVGIQRLVVISKSADGQQRTQTITEVRFVPMTGKARDGG